MEWRADLLTVLMLGMMELLMEDCGPEVANKTEVDEGIRPGLDAHRCFCGVSRNG